VAKKRKGSRPSSSKGGKKKKASKSARTIVTKPRTGLESSKQVDFGPLKSHIRAHIDRLSKVKEPSPAVANALRSLQQVSADLTGQCQPSMILPTES
jgi:hypothetical protein